jgi:hypothetical protein
MHLRVGLFGSSIHCLHKGLCHGLADHSSIFSFSLSFSQNCHHSYMGNTSRSITVQAGPGINVRPLSQK